MRIRMPHTRQYGRGGRRTLAGERTEGHDESDREQNITVRAERGRPSPLLRSWITVHLNANHNNAVGHQGGKMLSVAGKNRRSDSAYDASSLTEWQHLRLVGSTSDTKRADRLCSRIAMGTGTTEISPTVDEISHSGRHSGRHRRHSERHSLGRP